MQQRREAMATTLHDIVKVFEITQEGMEEVERRLTSAFKRGLEREGDDVPVKMFVTHVHSLSCGSEQGSFLGLDIGGSHFSILLIALDNVDQERIRTAGLKLHGNQVDKTEIKMKLEEDKIHSSQEVLFDFIAQSLADFIKDNNIAAGLPLGVTFSFPIDQTSLTSGTLKRWTKGFTASGAVGRDVIEMLKDAFTRRGGDIDVDLCGLVNDTTATQLAIGTDDHDCHVGVILGTGTNACYMENLDAVKKYNGDRSKYSQVIVNTEWGAFGDDGALDPWLTEFDRELDKNVVNCREQIFEKMISAKYLGELVRLALQKLVKSGQLFGGKSSAIFARMGAFESSYVYIIEGSDTKQCKELLKKNFDLDASDEDCEVVRKVCEAVSTRAARLAAAGIVALVRKIDKLDKCTVAVDGSLYKLHPKFSERMQTAMNQLAPGNNIKMTLSEEGSGQGAAIVASVACRQRDTGEKHFVPKVP